MQGTSRRLRTFGVVAAVLAMIAGCSAAPESDTPPDSSAAADPSADLIAAAQKEGTLTYYTVNTEAAAQVQADAFTAKYGIQVERVRLTGGELDARFAAEINSASGTSADIVFSTNPSLIRDAMDSGALVSLEDAKIPGFPWDYPEAFLQPDLGSALTLIEPAGIAYNTDLIKGDDIPKGWSDLLDPKWKGQVAIADPTASLGYIGEWAVIAEQEGGNYLSKLGAQQLKTYPASSAMVGALGAGEVSLVGAILGSHVVAAQAKGAPVDYVVPDNTSGIQTYVGIVAKAQHPNAARLFAMYSMSEEGAQILADASVAVSPYDTSKLPKNYEGADIEGAPAVKSEIEGLLQIN